MKKNNTSFLTLFTLITVFTTGSMAMEEERGDEPSMQAAEAITPQRASFDDRLWIIYELYEIKIKETKLWKTRRLYDVKGASHKSLVEVNQALSSLWEEEHDFLRQRVSRSTYENSKDFIGHVVKFFESVGKINCYKKNERYLIKFFYCLRPSDYSVENFKLVAEFFGPGEEKFSVCFYEFFRKHFSDHDPEKRYKSEHLMANYRNAVKLIRVLKTEKSKFGNWVRGPLLDTVNALFSDGVTIAEVDSIVDSALPLVSLNLRDTSRGRNGDIYIPRLVRVALRPGRILKAVQKIEPSKREQVVASVLEKVTPLANDVDEEGRSKLHSRDVVAEIENYIS